jgi:hypothetical protein
LQPAGGAGDKVFPPTYGGAVYAVERSPIPGREHPIDCVLIDSVQSQANRMEEALQEAVNEGRLNIPVTEVDFAGRRLLTEIGRVQPSGAASDRGRHSPRQQRCRRQNGGGVHCSSDTRSASGE